jgi:hypothetical protein
MMKASLKGVVLAATALLLGAVSAFAQQATITGTVTDTSGGVLPGVTITIIHEETGNTFEAVTDAQGQFRIPVDREPCRLPDHCTHRTAAVVEPDAGSHAAARTGDAH